MNLSPRSQEVIDALQKEGSWSAKMVTFGPFEDPQKKVLKILVDNYDDLDGKTGEAQARGLFDLFIEAEKLEEIESQSPPDPQSQEEAETIDQSPPDSQLLEGVIASDESEQPDEWRLTGLECESYRGSGPPGETIEFPFNGRSTLIYGPNGSGKSSLLGAVVWALTGKAFTDSVDEVTSVPLHKPSSKGEKKGSKIREWSVAATLPEKDPASVTEACRVELELSCPNDSRKLYVRRTLSDGLEIKEEESQAWKTCSNLSDYGITPLDLQLSLIAPSVFGRLTIENAQNSGQLLSLMLGLDDVENIGRLAGAIARNRTGLSNRTIKERDQAWEKLLENIAGLPGGLKETSESRAILKEFSAKQKPSLVEIEEIGKTIKSHRDEANQSIALALAFPVDEGDDNSDEEKDKGAKQVSESLAESLRAAVIELKKGTESCFPVLNSISPDMNWDKETNSDSGEWLKLTDKALEDFFETVHIDVKAYLDWLRQKDKIGPKANLLLLASKFYEDQTGDCPVCEEYIKNEQIKSHLRTFQNFDPSLLKEIDDFFHKLRYQLDKIVSQNIQALAAQTPSERLITDWAALKNVLGTDLAPIAKNYEVPINRIKMGITLPKAAPPDLMPSDAEKEFCESAEEFLNACSKSRIAVGMFRWASENLAALNTQLFTHLTEIKGDSLLSTLSKGSNAAEDVRDLERIRMVLAEAYKSRKEIATFDEIIAVLGRLKDSLEPIKQLENNALEIVRNEFKNIKEDTLNNWDQLYPEHTTGLSPANLFLEGTKDRKIQSYLGRSDFEVPGQYFANAGLLRAIALSFFFALLEKHPKGLGFVVMDDPILSLDDEHRDKWSGNILKPCMKEYQFIFATHQEVYLDRIGSIDFAGEIIVELNDRSDGTRISWKPGLHLDRAEELIKNSHDVVPNILRKYIESLLLTFETYCDEPIFNQYDLKKSIAKFTNHGPPLNGQHHGFIATALNDPKLLPVVHDGSHANTDHGLTKPEIRDQLTLLIGCQKSVVHDLKRLEKLKIHIRRKRPVQTAVVKSLVIPTPANWNNQPISLTHLGRAAAKGDALIIDSSEEHAKFQIDQLSPILVSGDTLDPVAKKGQWVLLYPDDVSITDGCLAAVLTTDGSHLLRRVWPDGDDFLLESINPVKRIGVRKVPRETTTIRKVAGVVFRPRQSISSISFEMTASRPEWQESKILTPDTVSKLNAITAEGESLEPIALKGQLVLVGEGTIVSNSSIHSGSLAVLETKNSDVGDVIKRIFPSGDHWTLVSPNPVNPHDPMNVSCSDILQVYPFCGVLFDAFEQVKT